MSGRIYQAVTLVGAMLRDIGSSLRGVTPPLRSPDGTFGTQRMQAKEREAKRRSSYPSG